MKQIATVVRHNGRLMAEVTRQETCRACRGCDFGRRESVYLELGDLACREGDQVSVETEEGMVARGSLAAYGLPALTTLAGLFLGSVFLKKDALQALCALAGLGLGLAAVRWIDRKSPLGRRCKTIIRPLSGEKQA